MLMICAATLWSIAGVFTRHLEVARGFEITFLRSLFSAMFVLGALLWQQGASRTVLTVRGVGWLGLLCGMMWCVMFVCYMIALTKTTVANTLVVMSISPLLTAFMAWLILKQVIPARTWCAILVAFVGILWMFAQSMSALGGQDLFGMMIALAVPFAAAINIIAMKKAGHGIDLIPAILLGSLFSAGLMLPLAWPLQASLHDVVIMAILGFFQLGFPCMLMIKASRSLTAAEMSLLALLEVLLGPLWAWLGAGEVPAQQTLVGGGIVLMALIFNGFLAMHSESRANVALRSTT